MTKFALLAAVVEYKNSRAITRKLAKDNNSQARFLDALRWHGAPLLTVARHCKQLQDIRKEYMRKLSRTGKCKRRLVTEIRKMEQQLGRKPRAFK